MEEMAKKELSMGFEELADAVIQGDLEKVVTLTKKKLEGGAAAREIIDKGFIAGMSVVGERMRNYQMFIPEVMLSARAMQAGLALLKPLLVEEASERKKKVVLGTVRGDLHTIGKDLVAMMLEGAGYEVVDLGPNVSPQAFVEAVHSHEPHLVGMSALLTTTMEEMKEVIRALEEGGLREQVRIMVGGAPLTQGFAHSIGADGYAPDAASAVELANSLVAEDWQEKSSS